MARPTKLDDDRIARITQLLRAGNTIVAAATASGISERAFHDWMARGEEGAEGDELFVQFRQEVQRAIGESEAILTKNVILAADSDWRAAAWVLERRFSSRWQQVHKLQGEIEHSGRVTHEIEIPDDAERLSDVATVMNEIGVIEGTVLENGHKALEAGDEEG